MINVQQSISYSNDIRVYMMIPVIQSRGGSSLEITQQLLTRCARGDCRN